jgi:hypothetical protein
MCHCGRGSRGLLSSLYDLGIVSTFLHRYRRKSSFHRNIQFEKSSLKVHVVQVDIPGMSFAGSMVVLNVSYEY